MSDPTGRFAGRVRAYALHRPSYPPDALDHLRTEVGLLPGQVIADLGSGTGILSRLLVERGYVVRGVEPNREMQEAAEALMAGEPRFSSWAGRAEATGLPDASVDAVTAAQAFHWFDPDATRREASRILRPDGLVVLLWNTRLTTTPFLQEYDAFLRRWGTDYQEVRASWEAGGALARFFGAGGFHRASFPNLQTLTLEGLRGRVASSSYTPAPGDPDHGPMLEALRTLFGRHEEGGIVKMEYETEVYHGRLSGDRE